MMIAALIVFSQLALAKPIERMTHRAAVEAVESSTSYKQIERLHAEGKFLTDDPKLAGHITKSVETRIADIIKFDNEKLMNLINIDPKLTLAKIYELSSIAKDTNSNTAERAEATKALELMFLSGQSVRSTAKNAAEAQANRKLLSENLASAEKVASFVNIKGTEKFIADFALELEKGKTAKDAITIAGKGKGKDGKDITEEQVRNCNKG